MDPVLRRTGLLFISTAVLIFAFSCASKPPAPSPDKAPEAVETDTESVNVEKPADSSAPVQSELDSLLERAKELKKQAFDLRLYEILADDYKAADAMLAQGKEYYDAGNAESAKTELTSAIDAFESLIKRGLSELASVSKEEAEEQRAAAVGAGAEQKAADRLFAGDETYVEAESLAAETKTEDAVFRYERARLYYELAYKRSIALSLMDTIREKDYARWDSGNFQLGEKKFNLEETLWSSDDESKRSDGLDALDEAVLRFNLVIQKGRESVALAAKTNAEASKTRAEEIKADAAAREEYAEAAELLREAESLFQYKEYEEALAVYERAMSAFDRAYETAAEKRSRAAQALRAAQEAVEKSREKADSADPIVNTGAP